VTVAAAPVPEAPARGGVRHGLICGFIAYAMWGLFPIYMRAVADAMPLEIVAHRSLWSLPVGAAALLIARQWRETRDAIISPKVLRLLAVSAALIALNWLVYIWAVNNGRVLQASLGYYINPLIFIAMGVVVLKERLRPVQLVAVALAGLGVLILTFGASVFPWPSFVMALSFTCYGLVRKTTPVGAMPGLFVETLVLAPFALLYFALFEPTDGFAFGAHGIGLDVLLALAGPITVVPLLLFALAARRLTLTTIGFLQYIGPTLQFACGLHYGEAFTMAHAACFALIWTALALISADAVRRNGRVRPEVALQTASATPKT
jgi:chloramphenicol-sensitive protein RarD